MRITYYNILAVDDSTSPNEETFAPFIHTNKEGARFLDFTKIVPIPDDVRTLLKESDAYNRDLRPSSSLYASKHGLWLLNNWGCSGPSESRLYPFGLYFATLDSPPITTVWQFAEQLGRPLLLAWMQVCLSEFHSFGFYRVDRKGEIVDSDSFDSETPLPKWFMKLWVKKSKHDSARGSAESPNHPLRWGLLD